MQLLDHLDEILGAFRKQRLRTALTASGIAIGAFAITLMIGLGQGLQTYIESQFLAFDNDRVLIVYPKVEFGERLLDQLSGLGRPARKITEEREKMKKQMRAGLWIQPDQVEKIKALPGVESIRPMTWLEVDGIALVDPDTDQAGRWEADFAATMTSPLLGDASAGRLPRVDAEDEVCLSPQYAESWGLAPEELVGREVEIRVPLMKGVSRRFAFRDPKSFEDKHEFFRAKVVGLAEKSPISRAIYVSIGFGQRVIRYQSDNKTLLSDEKIGFQAGVKLAKDADADAIKRAIKEEIGLSARSISDQLKDVQRVFLVVDLVLTSFGLLALFVATLGIANTLLMAITERTREIGVMKALGMTESTIRRMFALEAAAIGLVGGLAGMLAAGAIGLVANVVVARFVPAAQGLEGYQVFFFPTWLLFGAPVFSSLIGGLAGIYPANRAAQLDPIEALHHE